jgi:uncharacterized beta barrel domain-containing protein DUF5777
MKYFRIGLLLLMLLPFFSVAHDTDATDAKPEDKKTVDKPERKAFESDWLINNPTNVVNTKKTFQFAINHRFGVMKGNNDLVGIWGAANIRLGFSYSITDRISIGYGTTKNNRLQDFNLKAALLRQTRSGSVPVSITYYGNIAIDARDKDNFFNATDRLSYFNSIIIARRFSRKVSFQVVPSLSHYNSVESSLSNDQFAVAAGGRVKVGSTMAILVDYSQPLGQNSDNPGLSLGIEMSTGSHAFQVFVGNYNGIVPQQNYMFNRNKLSEGTLLIGFNITRLWGF